MAVLRRRILPCVHSRRRSGAAVPLNYGKPNPAAVHLRAARARRAAREARSAVPTNMHLSQFRSPPHDLKGSDPNGVVVDY